MIDPDETLFEELISEELAAVTFVRDYVQLQFGSPPTLNAYTPVTVRSQGTASRSGDSFFAGRKLDVLPRDGSHLLFGLCAHTLV